MCVCGPNSYQHKYSSTILEEALEKCGSSSSSREKNPSSADILHYA